MKVIVGDKLIEEIQDRVDRTAIALTNKERDQMMAVLQEFAGMFSGQCGRAKGVTHQIDTGEARPVNIPMYRYTPAQHKEIDRPTAKLLKAGRIRPGKDGG